MKERIGIFGGTLEGRLLAEFCQKRKIPAGICVATEYGKQLLREEDGLLVSAGKMDEQKMREWITKHEITSVIDATHPFARMATQEIQNACKKADIPYCRLIREKKEACRREEKEEIDFVESVQEAARRLNQEMSRHPGKNALITTGSKELSCFSVIQHARDCLYIRVIPSLEAIQACQDAGFFGKHIIAMQGPFSYELNCALIRAVHASYLVTKESGHTGGFEEKTAAAKDCGCHVIAVGRVPEEEGKSLEEVKQWILSEQAKKRKSFLSE